MSGSRGGWLTVVCVLLLCLRGGEARGVELEETIWGFGDSVPGEQFGLVSVLLRNDDPESFEEDVELYSSRRGIGFGGTVLIEKVFIGPNSSRWVQFYPYRVGYQTEWSLKCGRRTTFELPTILGRGVAIGNEKRAGPQTAWLQGETRTSSARGAFPTFPAELFPASVSGTQGLHIAILNEAPRWDQPRRESFLQWLNRGGVLHLYQGGDGIYPKFTAELELLNGESTEQKVGQGKVIRHAQGIGGAGLDQILPAKPQETVGQVEQYYNYSLNDNAELFRNLRELVAPRHQWPLIWLASVVYLLLIFPGGYLLGKARRDFRLVMGLQIGSALLFTFLFSVIGARGYNETSRNLAVGVARPVGGGKWDLGAWNNVFATSGGDYRITFPKRGGIFGTGVDVGETLRGVIANGIEGGYTVDIPPYSSCTFLSQSVVDGPTIEAEISHWDPENPGSLVCAVKSGWPEGAERAFVYLNDSLYTMSRVDDRLTVSSVSNLKSVDPWSGSRNVTYEPRSEEQDLTEWLNVQMRELEERVAEGVGVRRVRSGENLDGRAILMIPAAMPAHCFPSSGVEGKPAGRILYTLDLVVPGR